MSFYVPKIDAHFLHIPATGGVWVEKSCQRSGLTTERRRVVASTVRNAPVMHGLLAHYSHRRGLRPSGNRIIFSTVRHPAALLKSIWKKMTSDPRGISHYRKPERSIKRRGRRWHPFTVPAQVYRRGMDYSTWLRRLYKARPAYVSRLYELYIGPVHGEFVHYVMRTESLHADLVELLAVLGHEADTSGWSRSENRSVTNNPDESDEDRELIETSDYEAISRFYEGAASRRLFREHRRLSSESD